ncbi:MAG: DUF4145 domain-containing protein [Polyangiaceae bacterium]
MSVRESVRVEFRVDDQPGWTCSRCGKGRLVFSEKSQLRRQTADSSRDEDEYPDWEPQNQVDRFAAILTCEDCGDPVAVGGDAHCEDFAAEDQPEDFRMVLVPTHVSPAPRIVPRPGKLPRDVEGALRRSEGLFWSDEIGCANAIRSVVEAVLTDQRVRRFATAKGRRVRVNLHERILEFGRTRDQPLSKAMLAVKWLGNAGSHAGGAVLKADLFDGFDLLEHVLRELYDARARRMARLARSITKARGPLSQRRRRKPAGPPRVRRRPARA